MTIIKIFNDEMDATKKTEIQLNQQTETLKLELPSLKENCREKPKSTSPALRRNKRKIRWSTNWS